MILIIVASLVALVLSLLFGVVYIAFLKKKMMIQYIRKEGPQSHQEKSKTPTTGGLFIVVSTIVAALIALFMQQVTTNQAFIVIITFIFFTLAGFQDDINKIKHKANDKGLSAKGKLFLQCAIAILPTLYVTLNGHTALMFGDFAFDLGFFYPIFAIFFIAGVSNAVNLTDGLDGLASGNLIISFFACAFLCAYINEVDIAIISSAASGALIGFLYFNKHKAKVFMGDTGSLALGGLLATIAIVGKFELWLIFIGFIYMIETLSVMLQVFSFKVFGKRIFKMSPIHHHFELSGWSENKILIVSSSITLIMCAICIFLFIKFTQVV